MGHTAHFCPCADTGSCFLLSFGDSMAKAAFMVNWKGGGGKQDFMEDLHFQ